MKNIVTKFVAVAIILAAVAVGGTADAAFSRYLTVGSTGADVTELQQILVSNGYLVMPAGASYGYFGTLTKNAVAKWQAAVGLPATGYFGPMSIAKIGMSTGGSTGGSTTGGSTGGSSSNDLSGGDGDFSDFDVLGNPDSEDLEEGETKEVLGFEFEADGSDLRLERINVLFAETASDTKPWKVFEEVSVTVDGDEVANVDASDSDNWDEEEDDEYSISLEKLDAKIDEGEMAEVMILVTVSDDLDEDEQDKTWYVELMEDGVRARNAEGIDVYESGAGADDNIDSDADERDFTIDELTAGDLSIQVNGTDNEDDTVEVSEDDETTDVLLYTASIESEEGDNLIEEVTVTIATTTGTANGLSDFIGTLYLYIDGDEVGSESVGDDDGSEAITFDDIDFELEDGEEVDLEVRADIESQEDNFTAGAGVYVDEVAIDYVDGNDDDLTETEGTNGGEISFRVEGIMVELVDTSYTRVFTADDSGEKDRVEYVIEFKVTAFGDEDIFIDKSVQNGTSTQLTAAGGGVGWATTTDSTGTTTTSSTVFSASGDTGDDTSAHYLVEEGETRTFTLKVTLEAGQDGASGVQLTGINYDTDSTINLYETSDLDDYKVDPISINII